MLSRKTFSTFAGIISLIAFPFQYCFSKSKILVSFPMVKKVIFHPKLLVCRYTVLNDDFLGPVIYVYLLILSRVLCDAWLTFIN